jgi:hypothetical protein
MRRSKLLYISAVCGMATGAAYGQPYDSARPDPCRPQRTFLGGIAPMSEQQRAACEAERKAQWDDYYARQHAQQQQQATELAVQQEAQQEEQAKEQREQAQRNAAEKQREREELIQRRNAYTQLIATETSPDNHCKVPDVARVLLEQWSSFDVFKEANVSAIDIEHLTTTAFDPVSVTMICHGIFVTNRGLKLVGSIQIRKNVAGDPITTWMPDSSQDLSGYAEPPPLPDEPQTAPLLSTERVTDKATVPGVAIPSVQSVSFSEGLADRKSWEAWLGSLPADEARGAQWWAANRNVPNHGTCATAAGDDATFTAGCLNAQGRLTQVDIRRRSDTEFRKGWNSF